MKCTIHLTLVSQNDYPFIRSSKTPQSVARNNNQAGPATSSVKKKGSMQV